MKIKQIIITLLVALFISCGSKHEVESTFNKKVIDNSVSEEVKTAQKVIIEKNNPFKNFDIDELHKKLNLNTFHSSFGPKIEDKTKPAFISDFYSKYTAAGSCENEISALIIDDTDWHYEIIPLKIYDYNNDGIMDLEAEFIDQSTKGLYDTKSHLIISKKLDGTFACIKEIDLYTK